jgi:hypothetical protein
MMYALKLNIKSSDKVANLSINSASQNDMDQVISLLTALFQVELGEVKPVKIPDQVVKVNLYGKEISKSTVSRKLPLIESSRTEMVSLGEKLQEALKPKLEEPEFYKTGIKIDEDGTKRYKCRYTCGCGKKGNHYIPLKTHEVTCHECDQPLDVWLAADKVDALGIPVRDGFGNYYIAGLEI